MLAIFLIGAAGASSATRWLLVDAGAAGGRGLRELDLDRRRRVRGRGARWPAAMLLIAAAPAERLAVSGALRRRRDPGDRPRLRRSCTTSSWRRDCGAGGSPIAVVPLRGARRTGFPIGCAAFSICRPLAGVSADRISGDLRHRRCRAGGAVCDARSRSGDRRQAAFMALRGCSRLPALSFSVAAGQHARRQQRSRLARGAAGGRWCSRSSPRPGLRAGSRRGAWAAAAAASPRSLLGLPDGGRARPRATRSGMLRAGRQGVRADAGDVGGGAPARRARRAGRQQSAVPAGHDAMAGQHLLGAAGGPPLLLCRPRARARLRVAAARAPRRDRRAVHPRVCGQGRAAATSSDLAHAYDCRRGGASTRADGAWSDRDPLSRAERGGFTGWSRARDDPLAHLSPCCRCGTDASSRSRTPACCRRGLKSR